MFFQGRSSNLLAGIEKPDGLELPWVMTLARLCSLSLRIQTNNPSLPRVRSAKNVLRTVHSYSRILVSMSRVFKDKSRDLVVWGNYHPSDAGSHLCVSVKSFYIFFCRQEQISKLMIVSKCVHMLTASERSPRSIPNLALHRGIWTLY